MARIVNNTQTTLVINDILDNSVTQYQDGVKVFTLGPGASALIPNLQAANSVALKALSDDGKVSVATGFEPTNIIGMAGI